MRVTDLGLQLDAGAEQLAVLDDVDGAVAAAGDDPAAERSATYMDHPAAERILYTDDLHGCQHLPIPSSCCAICMDHGAARGGRGLETRGRTRRGMGDGGRKQHTFREGRNRRSPPLCSA